MSVTVELPCRYYMYVKCVNTMYALLPLFDDLKLENV